MPTSRNADLSRFELQLAEDLVLSKYPRPLAVKLAAIAVRSLMMSCGGHEVYVTSLGPERLSERQAMVFQLLGQGKTNVEIQRLSGYKPRTVRRLVRIYLDLYRGKLTL